MEGPPEKKETMETVVLNLMDGREHTFRLPPQRAVVAAHELFDLGICNIAESQDPTKNPEFKEYTLGYACGDWIAYKDSKILKAG